MNNERTMNTHREGSAAGRRREVHSNLDVGRLVGSIFAAA